jgi:Flp pilus assembly protein TadG
MTHLFTLAAMKRRAVASAELAVCLPVMVLLVFGSIEATCFIFLQQSLQVAAYEGARDACRIDATHEAATARARNILDSRDVQGASIQFHANDIGKLSRGEPVIVEVTAPTRKNSPLAGQWIANRDLRARVYMLKE